jgi:hypothetical protein
VLIYLVEKIAVPLPMLFGIVKLRNRIFPGE